MLIKMLRTERGSENGVTVQEYCKDQLYEVGDELAKSFIDAGIAMRADDAAAVEEMSAPAPAHGTKKAKHVEEKKGNAPTASAGNRTGQPNTPSQDIWE